MKRAGRAAGVQLRGPWLGADHPVGHHPGQQMQRGSPVWAAGGQQERGTQQGMYQDLVSMLDVTVSVSSTGNLRLEEDPPG